MEPLCVACVFFLRAYPLRPSVLEAAATCMLAYGPNRETAMPKFVIEREVPGAGNLSDAQIREITQKSVGVLKEMGPSIQWLHSYVTGDKVYSRLLKEQLGQELPAQIGRRHRRQLADPARGLRTRQARRPSCQSGFGRTPPHRPVNGGINQRLELGLYVHSFGDQHIRNSLLDGHIPALQPGHGTCRVA